MSRARPFVGALVLAPFLLATRAGAQGPAEFRSSAELTLSTRDALHRFPLPVEAYRDARRDLGDLRVFNAAGEGVPFAFSGGDLRARDTAVVVALRHFPVFGAARDAAGDAPLDVSVRARSDGTLISVQSRVRASAGDRPVAWLLDASRLGSAIHALLVEWEVGPGAEVVHVSVEASDDLRNWRAVTSRATLVRVSQGGEVLSQPRVDFTPQRARYLRISGEGALFQLRGARAELQARQEPAPRERRTFEGALHEKGRGEYLVDLGAWLPVESFRVLLASPNSVAPIELLSRDAESEEWRHVARGTFYRLTRDGAEVRSPSVGIAPRADRYWLLRVDARSGGLGDVPPSLEVAWRPAQVVFVARGEPPFRVAFGHRDAAPAALSLTSLVPGYSEEAEGRLPIAALGPVQSVALPGDGWRRVMGDVSGRTIALWGTLLAGVALLGVMAWRISRQLPN